jgi:prophage antirepressor-like protein
VYLKFSSMQTENLTPMAFEFSATKQAVRSLLIHNEPWLVAKDVCDILELSDTNKALAKLDSDEKLTRKVFGSGQNRKMWLVSESGLYALIMRSNKPEAKAFRKWVTGEVLPAIRKKGFYGTAQTKTDFIDARATCYTRVLYNATPIRCITLKEVPYYSIADFLKAVKSGTAAFQAAKKLNAKKQLAFKIWVFGNTHPSWFTTTEGLKLLASGMRVKTGVEPLKLAL